MRLSAGRGSLVRQAIARLVRFPLIAGSISAAERAGLNTCEEPGIDLLRELLDDLRVHPLSVPAQVLERWADRSGGEHLGRLLEREEVLGDAQAAALELKAALAKLADQAVDGAWRHSRRRAGRLAWMRKNLRNYRRLCAKRPASKPTLAGRQADEEFGISDAVKYNRPLYFGAP